MTCKDDGSRPYLMVRTTWPLFLVEIATPDWIYQEWMSTRLKKLGRSWAELWTSLRIITSRGIEPYRYEHHEVGFSSVASSYVSMEGHCV